MAKRDIIQERTKTAKFMIKKINEDLKDNEGFLDEPEEKPTMMSSKDAKVPIVRYPPGSSGEFAWRTKGGYRLRALSHFIECANWILNLEQANENHKQTAAEFLKRVKEKNPTAKNLLSRLSGFTRYLKERYE